MAWSTREIADLAGTSLRAVRHHHEVGLLAEPERRSNGYKQYGVSHLVRLLHIKRLVDLGFSPARIAELGEDDHHPAEALRTLDAELGATIERPARARVEPAPRGARSATRIAAAAMRELYNPAQVDVFRRVRQLLRADARRADPAEDAT